MAAQDIVINFDDLPVNTVVTNQYHDKGVDFFGQPSGGLLPVITQVPPGEAHSGNQLANISTCVGCEFFTPFVTGRFTNTVQHISVYVGQFAAPKGVVVDPAEITLTAFDAAGQQLVQSAPVTVTAGGGFNTLLSTETPSATIASFEVSARVSLDASKQLGMDHLTFGSTEISPPDFNVSAAIPVVAVSPSSSTVDTITIHRFNGSAGPVQFTVSNLPQGITATFVPDPADNSTTLTFTAAADAPLTGPIGATVTVTATPLVPGAGSAPRTIQIGIFVRPDFTLKLQSPAQIELGPCGTVKVSLAIARAIEFQTAIINLSAVGLPTGIQASFDPPSVGAPPDGGFVNEVTLSLTLAANQPVADTATTIQATSGSETSTVMLHIHIVAGGINSFTPHSGFAPQSLREGTEVVIQGAGFCPGSQVGFGTGQKEPQLLATATPTSISEDGRELHVKVPRLATDGPLTVITPGGTHYVSQDTFTVHSYRNTNGFSFENYPYGGCNFDDVVELYGNDQTHIFFGLIPDPFALAYTFLANEVLKSHESCHGISLISQRLLHGDLPFSAFTQPGATTVWQLDGPTGPASALAHYIHVIHLAQFSAEFIHFYLARAAGNLIASINDIKSQVLAALSAGDHPLVTIRKPLTDGFHGHVIVAYDLEEGTPELGDFYIRVYDPNVEFAANVQTNKVDENNDNRLHTAREQNSRIHVAPDRSWSFPNLNWSGGLESLIVVPYSVTPLHPTIPTSLSGLLTLVFGDGSQTTQIADAEGHTLFRTDGTLNTDPTTSLPLAAPFPPLDSTGLAHDLYALGGDGPYTHTVRTAGSNGYHYMLLGSNFAARVENPTATQGSEDALIMDRQAAHLQFRTGEAKRDLKTHLLARVPEGDVRIATFSTTSFQGQGDSFAFDQARQALTYKHVGAATSYSFTLEATNQQGQRAQFVSPALQIQSNDTATFAPSDWRGLDRATVTVTTTRSDGTSQVQTISNQDYVITEVAGYFTPIDGFQHAIAATRDGKVHEVSFHPQSGIAQDVLSTFSNITSIAGYFTPIDGFQHVIVATADGNVHEVYFNPQKGIFQDVLAHFDGIIDIAGFFTPDDDFQHVLVATQDGNLHEVYFNPQKGIFQDVFAHFNGIVALDGFFTPDDNYRHAIVATNDGNVYEVYFNPQKGIFQDVLAHFDGIVDVAGFFTPDDNYRHAIVATSDGNLHEVYFNPQKGIFQDVLTHFDGIGRIGAYFTPTDGNRHVIAATNDGALHEVHFNPQKGIFQDVLTTFTT